MSENQIAWTYYKGKVYEKSQTKFSNLIVGYPESVSADDWQFMLGKISYDSGEYNEAINKFQELIEEYSSKEKRIYKNKVPEAELMIGNCEFKQKNYSEAINIYQKFVIEHEKNNLVSESWTGMAKVYFQQGMDQFQQKKYNEAINYFNEGIRIYKENRMKHIMLNEVFPSSYSMKAESYVKLGNKEEAIKVLEELIEEFRASPKSEEAEKRIEELKE